MLPRSIVVLASTLRFPHVRGQTNESSSTLPSNDPSIHLTGTWGSGVYGGVYATWSNDSDASFTFSFSGNGLIYLASQKYDRGKSGIIVDDGEVEIIDLWIANTTGPVGPMWNTTGLKNGVHNVTLTQVGIDERLGFYPWLFSESWTVLAPGSTGTKTSSGSSSTSPPTSKHHGTPPTIIAAGVAGCVVVVGLLVLGMFIFFRRRGRAPDVKVAVDEKWVPPHEELYPAYDLVQPNTWASTMSSSTSYPPNRTSQQSEAAQPLFGADERDIAARTSWSSPYYEDGGMGATFSYLPDHSPNRNTFDSITASQPPTSSDFLSSSHPPSTYSLLPITPPNDFNPATSPSDHPSGATNSFYSTAVTASKHQSYPSYSRGVSQPLDVYSNSLPRARPVSEDRGGRIASNPFASEEDNLDDEPLISKPADLLARPSTFLPR